MIAAANFTGCKINKDTHADVLINLAERVGFEPTVGINLRLISSQVHSTTLPPLRGRAFYIIGQISGRMFPCATCYP